MTREEAKAEINKVFEPAFANYIITALTEGATPSERKAGKWIITTRNGILCGVCHSGFRRMPTLDGKPIFRYCPFCGAKMEGAE